MIKTVRAKVERFDDVLKIVEVWHGRKKVKPCSPDYLTAHHDSDYDLTRQDFLEDGLFEITYVLDPKGEYFLLYDFVYGVHKMCLAEDAHLFGCVEDLEESEFSFSCVCFIPKSWDQKIVSRNIRRMR